MRRRPPLEPPGLVGVVGLGAIGGRVAALLLAGGFEVAGYDIDGSALGRARAAGVTAAGGAGELAASCRLAVTSLPSAAALEDVASELAASPGSLRAVVEASTLALEDKARARRLLEAAGVELLDCPISGTAVQLGAGDAIVYASGDAGTLAWCAPVLRAFARQVVAAGAFGNGTKLKLLANLLVAVHNAAAAEALALAGRCGLEPALALQALRAGAGDSRMLEVRGPAMISRRYVPAAMRMSLFAKDLELIASFARALGAQTPLFDASVPLYARASALGHDDSDTASVLEALLAAESEATAAPRASRAPRPLPGEQGS